MRDMQGDTESGIQGLQQASCNLVSKRRGRCKAESGLYRRLRGMSSIDNSMHIGFCCFKSISLNAVNLSANKSYFVLKLLFRCYYIILPTGS